MAKISKHFFNKDETVEMVRINKFLSDAGICSRREADKEVEAGNVTIDGITAVMGSKVMQGQKVVFCGKEVKREDKLILIAFNKPQGIVCTTDRREPNNIIDYINYGKRIYPIGRLDKDSEGLILLTNNGDIVNKILRAGNQHEKEYIVTVNKPLTMEFLKGMSQGVPILDRVTNPCDIEAIDKMSFRIILTQGLNRQIRRMCEYFGYRVIHLQRIRIMNVNLGRLKLGSYRNLTDWELEELNFLIQESLNEPISKEEEKENPFNQYHEKISAKVLAVKKTISNKQKNKAFNMMEKEIKANDRKTSYRKRNENLDIYKQDSNRKKDNKQRNNIKQKDNKQENNKQKDKREEYNKKDNTKNTKKGNKRQESFFSKKQKEILEYKSNKKSFIKTGQAVKQDIELRESSKKSKNGRGKEQNHGRKTKTNERISRIIK